MKNILFILSILFNVLILKSCAYIKSNNYINAAYEQFEPLYLESSKSKEIQKLINLKLNKINEREISVLDVSSEINHIFFKPSESWQVFCDFNNAELIIKPIIEEVYETKNNNPKLLIGNILSHLQITKGDNTLNVYNKEVIDKYLELNETKCRIPYEKEQIRLQKQKAKEEQERKQQAEADKQKAIQAEKDKIEQQYEKIIQ